MGKRFSVLMLLLMMVGICVAFPKPAVIQKLNEWTVDVTFDQPKQVTVDIAGLGPQRFWYTIVTLTNKTGNEVDFYPECDLVTDTYQVVPAGKGIRKVVFDKIKIHQQGRYPFLESLDFTDNKILQGADNTVDIAIIWQDFCPKAKTVSLFISGLSNETVAIDHPVKKNQDGSSAKVHLRKTLELRYAVAGDEKLRDTANFDYKGKNWVMR